MKLELEGFSDIIINNNNMSLEFNDVVKYLFNYEVSNHGYNYINNLNPDSNLIRMELVYELIRKIEYSNCPSRYKSFFAVDKRDIKKLAKTINIDLKI